MPQQRPHHDEQKQTDLRAAISAGIDELDRGDHVEIDGTDLAHQLVALTVPRRKHLP